MHPIDQAIRDMQLRRRARTWPPITLDEFAELNDDALRRLAKERRVNANQSRMKLIIALYYAVHEVKRKIPKGSQV